LHQNVTGNMIHRCKNVFMRCTCRLREKNPGLLWSKYR